MVSSSFLFEFTLNTCTAFFNLLSLAVIHSKPTVGYNALEPFSIVIGCIFEKKYVVGINI